MARLLVHRPVGKKAAVCPRCAPAYAKGIAASDVACREGVPVATIYDRIGRARADFRATLAREDAAIYIRRRK